MKTPLLKVLALIAVSSLQMTSQTLPSYVSSSGLKGWWPFNGNANDESGNGNNGIVNGAGLTSDRASNTNRAYNCSGGYISCTPNGIPKNGPMSISAWFNASSDYQLGEFICLGAQGNTTWGAVGGNNSFTLNYGRNCGSTGSSLQPISLGYNQWHHIVYVSNGLNGQSDIYYDGTFFGISTNVNSSGSCSSSTLYFGTDVYFNRFYPGKLDDIGIWDRALTPCEITNLFYAANQCGSVGLHEFSKNDAFSIYPNPASGQLNLKSDASIIGAPYAIYDYTGKLIITEKIKQENTIINLETLSTGIYFLKAGGTINQTLKFIKN